MEPHPQSTYPIPEDTQRVARAALPKGNLYMRTRDELGEIYQDTSFAELFPSRGQKADSRGTSRLGHGHAILGRHVGPAGRGSGASADRLEICFGIGAG